MRRLCATLLATALTAIAPVAVAPVASADPPTAGAHVKSVRIRHRAPRTRRHRHRRHRHHHHRHHHRRRHRHRHPAKSGGASPKRRAARASLECADANALPTSSTLDSVRAATLCLVNRERALHGERPLRLNQKLQRAAQRHSEEMVAEDYFSHYEPSGEGPASRMRAAGYISSKIGYEVGENIAWGTLQLSTPSAIVDAWMHSPGHRANILDPRFRETAVGVVAALPRSYGKGQPGAIYTQDFGVLIPS